MDLPRDRECRAGGSCPSLPEPGTWLSIMGAPGGQLLTTLPWNLGLPTASQSGQINILSEHLALGIPRPQSPFQPQASAAALPSACDILSPVVPAPQLQALLASHPSAKFSGMSLCVSLVPSCVTASQPTCFRMTARLSLPCPNACLVCEASALRRQ